MESLSEESSRLQEEEHEDDDDKGSVSISNSSLRGGDSGDHTECVGSAHKGCGVRRCSSHGRMSCSVDIVNGGGPTISQLPGVHGVGSCKARLSDPAEVCGGRGSWTISGEVSEEDAGEGRNKPSSPESSGKARGVMGRVGGGEIGM